MEYFHLIIPYLIHITFVVGFIFRNAEVLERFTPVSQDDPEILSEFYFKGWFDSVRTITFESNFEAFFLGYLPYLWTGTEAFKYMTIWTVVVLGMIIFTTVHQARLYKMSKQIKNRNIFSGAFYMLFWVFFYLKLYAFINTLTASQSTQAQDPVSQALNWIIDIVLMLITIINLVRGFGQKKLL